MSDKCIFCLEFCGNDYCSYYDNPDLANTPTVDTETEEIFDLED